MSARQIEGAICETSNILYDRKFKPYTPNSTIDAYTLPAMANIRRTGECLLFHYQTLTEIHIIVSHFFKVLTFNFLMIYLDPLCNDLKNLKNLIEFKLTMHGTIILTFYLIFKYRTLYGSNGIG